MTREVLLAWLCQLAELNKERANMGERGLLDPNNMKDFTAGAHMVPH